jgi:hypothetical protein
MRISLDLIQNKSVEDTIALNLGRKEFTYGEVHDLTFLRFLNELNTTYGCKKRATNRKRRRGAFYDLGCGVGKPMFVAAVSDWDFERCVGVELLPQIRHIGLRLLGYMEPSLQQHYCARRADGAECASTPNTPAAIEFLLSDIKLVVLSTDTKLVYLCSQLFGDEMMSAVRYHCLREVVREECIIMTLKRPLPDTVVLAQKELMCSWGPSVIFVARLPEVDAPREGEQTSSSGSGSKRNVAATSSTASSSAATAGSTDSSTAEQPRYTLKRASGAMHAIVSLPLVDDMRGLELDVSEQSLTLKSSADAAHQYILSLELEERVDTTAVKAKFNKAARELRVTLPPL